MTRWSVPSSRENKLNTESGLPSNQRSCLWREGPVRSSAGAVAPGDSFLFRHAETLTSRRAMAAGVPAAAEVVAVAAVAMAVGCVKAEGEEGGTDRAGPL